MPNLAHEAARQTFFAGKMGIWTESTSLLRVADDSVGGRFKWRTAVFPTPGPNAKLPTGGMAAMMFATTPEKQKAAWDFMKFANGAAAQPSWEETGYRRRIRCPPIIHMLKSSTRSGEPRPRSSSSPDDAWYAFRGITR